MTDPFARGVFVPLVAEMLDLKRQATLPSKSLEPQDQPTFSSEGLQALGTFLLRQEVLVCLLVGIDSMEKRAKPKKRGRPKVGWLQSQDARRAFRVWLFVHKFSLQSATNRMLVDLQQRIEPLIYPGEPDEILFSKHVTTSSLEESLSRGRTELEIDDGWRSPLCEIIASK